MSGDSSPSMDRKPPKVEADLRQGLQDGGENALVERDWGQITLEEAVRPIAIAAMLTCICISLAQVVALVAPRWPGRFFTLLAFLVSLESIHAQRLISRSGPSQRDWWRFRFVEWVVILLVVRLGTSLGRGTQGLMADVASWSADLTTFLDLGFVAASVLMATFWGLAMLLSRAMQELEASPIEREPSITDPDFYLRSTMPRRGRTDRQARLHIIVTTFFWGGAVILLLSGFAQVDVRDLVLLRHSRSSGVILNVMAYFLIGLLLIGQAQYTILRANWELASIPILGRLGKRWTLLVASFLLLVALASALLPVSYSVGLLQAVSTAVAWLAVAIMQVVSLLLLVLSTILSLLLGRSSGSPTQSTRQPTPSLPPPPPSVANEPWPWWGVVRSLIFWVILTGVVGYSLLHFARDRWGLLRGISVGRLLAWLRGLWRSLRSRTRSTASRIRQGIVQRLASRRRRGETRAPRYLSLRRLSPRGLVRYYYLSILRRTSRQGFGRPPCSTPLEYQETLARELPDAADQVAQLSWAFVEARYSEHPISSQDAGAVKGAWRLVKRALAWRRRAADKGPTQSLVGKDGSS